MKLEIYEKPKEKSKSIVQLALKENEDGAVVVIAVDKYGERMTSGDLMYFQSNGTIYHPDCINPKFGFQLDKEGKIKEEK